MDFNKIKKEKQNNNNLIRNFSIIAHVDHGKSTIARKIINLTNSEKIENNEALHSLKLEEEKGITIKLNAIQLEYFQEKSKKKYIFNLIDTPGHADFKYEVSRSLAACEGVIILVDASKGIQSQTIEYFRIAKHLKLKFLPVINKIDLPSAQIELTQKQLIKLLGCKKEEICLISSKSGTNVSSLLDKIIEEIPFPENLKNENLKALVFDLLFDKFSGVIVYVRIFSGYLEIKKKIKLLSNNKIFQIEKIGVKKPNIIQKNELLTGEIGWFTANIRDMKDIRVGETISEEKENIDPLPGYQILKSNIYSNIFPEEISKYKELKKAIEELQIQDSSFNFEMIDSNLLGLGFRCGFLGLLHQDIIKERISKEYKIETISTPPSVIYRIKLLNGKLLDISNPQKFPQWNEIKSISEIFITIKIITPEKYLGNIMTICQNKRGIYKKSDIKTDDLWEIEYEIPFAEFIQDFNDKIKSTSQGYASFDYYFTEFKESKIVKIDILLNGQIVNDLSFLVHITSAYEKSKEICITLKENLNPQNFEVPIQACIGKKIISRETLKSLRKDVIGKCYGGDITRKKKLLEKQKKGKKKMKLIGKVSVSKDSFRNMLKKKI